MSSANRYVSAALPADLLTPVGAFLCLRREGKYGFLMESATGGEMFGRYSFLGINPIRELISERSGSARWSDHSAEKTRTLSELLSEYQQTSSTRIAQPLPFSGGLVGFIGFDFVREIELFPSMSASPLPQAWFGDYRTWIIFDHVKQIATIYSTLEHGADAEVARLSALLRIAPSDGAANFRAGERRAIMTKQEYIEAVCSFQRHIRAGDIFQGVLSQRFERSCSGDPFLLYRALRRVNPSPYMFYQETPVGTFVGASPELLVGVHDRKARLLPIAGTRPRGETDAVDKQYEQELLADPKERAEHMMLVDLARNDLGRVSEYGSVRVDETAVVHRFSHVMHMVSRVSGKLRPDMTAIDALRASFPAGTVSGAPKVRALELILEHEPAPRGFYSGAAGFLASDGNAEFCITLRTARIADGIVEYQTGAGIVADSNPEAEYNETLYKASAIERAIEEAGAS